MTSDPKRLDKPRITRINGSKSA